MEHYDLEVLDHGVRVVVAHGVRTAGFPCDLEKNPRYRPAELTSPD